MNANTYIIAEAGVNHNGSLDLAKQLVVEAARAGADAVKFQTFKADKLVSRTAEKAEYQQQTTGSNESQYTMLERLELGYEQHFELVEIAQDLGLDFLSTAFDEDSLQFLVKGLGLKMLKIPSGEITNAPLVLAHARTGCNLIVSTGMATLGEVEDVLSVIAFGLTAPADQAPGCHAFKTAYFSNEGQQALREKVTLLHCTTEYPAPMADINLRAMDTLGSAFQLPVGYSDHSEGITIPIAAAARGATLIEKHFTLDKRMEGPDHRASLDPHELHQMITAVRNVEAALGSGSKGPQASEIKNIAIARKSLVAARDIPKGHLLNDQDLAVMRPGNGVSPQNYWELLGKHASKKYRQGETISE